MHRAYVDIRVWIFVDAIAETRTDQNFILQARCQRSDTRLFLICLEIIFIFNPGIVGKPSKMVKEKRASRADTSRHTIAKPKTGQDQPRREDRFSHLPKSIIICLVLYPSARVFQCFYFYSFRWGPGRLSAFFTAVILMRLWLSLWGGIQRARA